MKRVIAQLLLLFASVSAQRLVSDRSAWSSNMTNPLVLPNLMPTVPYLPAARIVVQSSLNTGGDRDFFRFLNVRPGVVRIYSTGSTDVNCTVLLTTGAFVAENDNVSDGNRNFEVLFNATANTQYIVLVQSSSIEVSGDYDMSFETSVTDDIGNDLTEAIEVALPAQWTRFVLSANLEWQGDRDFYKFTPRVDGHIILAAGGALDTLATLWGTDATRNITAGQLRTNDDTNGVNYHIGYHLKGGTLYWLDSGSYNNGGMGAYTITVHFLPGDAVQPILSFTNHSNSISFLQGDVASNTLFSASLDRSSRRFGMDGIAIATYGWHTGNVWRVFRLNETRVLTGGCDGTSNNIREWDINGNPIRIWRNHTNCVWGFVRGSGNSLYTVSQDGRVVYWNIETGTAVWQRVFGTSIYDVAELPSNVPGALPSLLLAMSNGQVWEYRIPTGDIVRVFQASASAIIVRRLYVTKDFLFAADNAGTITQFSLIDGLPVRRYADPINQAVYGIWVHNGFLVTTTSNNPSFIRRWNMETGDLVDTAAIHNGITYHLIFFNGGFWTAGADFQIRFWGTWTAVSPPPVQPNPSPANVPVALPMPRVTSTTLADDTASDSESQSATLDAASVGGLVLAGIACVLILPAAGYLIYAKRDDMTMTQTMTQTGGPMSPAMSPLSSPPMSPVSTLPRTNAESSV